MTATSRRCSQCPLPPSPSRRGRSDYPYRRGHRCALVRDRPENRCLDHSRGPHEARVEHRVPLSDQALEVLRQEAKRQVNDVVFSGQKAGRPLSNMAFLMMLRRMGRDDLTVHGFRSTFRDWAAERTTVAPEVAEAALAHTIANKVEAAYRRSDLFEKRRALMREWGSFLDQKCHTDRNAVPDRNS
jgi:integrase